MIQRILRKYRVYKQKRHRKFVTRWMERRALERNSKLPNGRNELSQTQINEISRFYSKYPLATTSFHRFYHNATGKFHAEYIPDDLHVNYIDRYFNDWNRARYLDNKTL